MACVSVGHRESLAACHDRVVVLVDTSSPSSSSSVSVGHRESLAACHDRVVTLGDNTTSSTSSVSSGSIITTVTS